MQTCHYDKYVLDFGGTRGDWQKQRRLNSLYRTHQYQSHVAIYTFPYASEPRDESRSPSGSSYKLLVALMSRKQDIAHIHIISRNQLILSRRRSRRRRGRRLDPRTSASRPLGRGRHPLRRAGHVQGCIKREEGCRSKIQRDGKRG